MHLLGERKKQLFVNWKIYWNWGFALDMTLSSLILKLSALRLFPCSSPDPHPF